MSRLHHIVPAFRAIMLAGLMTAGQSLAAQTAAWEDAPTIVELRVGYTALRMPRTKGMLDQAEYFFRQQFGIRLQRLSAFRGNALVGGSVIVHLQGPIWFDVGGYFTRSSARLGYKDPNGSVDERFDARVYFPRGSFVIYLNPSDQFMRMYVTAGAGALIAELQGDETIEFTSIPEFNSSSSSTIRGTVLGLEAGGGLRVNFGDFILAAEAGFRFNPSEAKEGYSDTFDGWTFSFRAGVPVR